MVQTIIIGIYDVGFRVVCLLWPTKIQWKLSRAIFVHHRSQSHWPWWVPAMKLDLESWRSWRWVGGEGISLQYMSSQLGWWFQRVVSVHPDPCKKCSNLTVKRIFFKWVGEKPPTRCFPNYSVLCLLFWVHSFFGKLLLFFPSRVVLPIFLRCDFQHDPVGFCNFWMNYIGPNGYSPIKTIIYPPKNVGWKTIFLLKWSLFQFFKWHP